MRVLVTRPASEAAAWVDALRARGFDAAALPLIDIRMGADPQPLDACWAELERDDAVMFVSRNAVDGFFARRALQRSWPLHTRAWATGRSTYDALVSAGVPLDLIDVPALDAPQFDSEALWRGVGAQVRTGFRVLIVRGADAVTGSVAGRDWLATQLREAGAGVREVAAYVRCMPVFGDAARALAAQADVWIFSSTQGIANLRSWAPRPHWSDARAVATHPRIAQAAREAGFGVVRESRPAMDDVARVLESFR